MNTPHLLQIVDDDVRVRKLIRTFFERRHFVVRCASHGEEAYEQCLVALPALLITDVTMPRMNGIELIAKLRRLPGGAAIPVIVLSALAADYAAVATDADRADVYLTKPAELTVLAGHVERLLRTTKPGL